MIAAMARQLRLEFPGALYHLTARGNAREAIYRDDVDRELFLALLGREIEQQGWQCYAYCLMDNYYHLLIETPEPPRGRGSGLSFCHELQNCSQVVKNTCRDQLTRELIE